MYEKEGNGLMCRSIKTPVAPATDEEIRAAALQYVRKISGYRKPSQVNAASFERAVEEVATTSRRLLSTLKSPAMAVPYL